MHLFPVARIIARQLDVNENKMVELLLFSQFVRDVLEGSDTERITKLDLYNIICQVEPVDRRERKTINQLKRQLLS